MVDFRSGVEKTDESDLPCTRNQGSYKRLLDSYKMTQESTWGLLLTKDGTTD